MLAKKLNAKQRQRLKEVVEEVLSKYRLYKFYSSPADYDTSITSNYSDEKVMTSGVSDKVASKAIHEVDKERERKAYIERIELAVKRLPKREREIIETRYMGEDSEYITDYNVYCFKLSEEISSVTYITIRGRAFYKLALILRLNCGFDLLDVV